MNVIAFRAILEFYEKHTVTKGPLRTFYTLLKHEDWKMPQDAVEAFGASNVDILNNDRICIDIKGRKIRVIVRMNYKSNTGFIRWIGWHKDYDKLGDDIHTI